MDATIAEFIISPLIVGIMAIAANYAMNLRTRRENAVEAAKREQRREDWEKRVEQKLDDHNGYAEKFAQASLDIREIKTEIKNIKANCERHSREV